MGFAISLPLMAFFFLLVAIFAGAETGLVCLDIQHLKHLAQQETNHRERALLKIAKQPERFLALTLIGINMSIVISTSLGTDLFEKYGPFWVSVETMAVSLFLFFACEVLPKMAFSANPLGLSLRILKIIEFSDRVLSIPIAIVTTLTRSIIGIMGLRGEKTKRKISRAELLILLSMGNASGVLTDRPHRMAKGIIGLKETRICEIMIPRVKMVALDSSSTVENTRKIFIESGFSRIPVYEGNSDQIIGIVYFKDFFLQAADKKNLRDYLKPTVFVPEVKNAYELFREMLTRKFQTAVVLDEFGATAGFITLEDLIEEVVGEIHDELDEPTARIKFHGDGTVTVKADLNFATLEEEAGISFEKPEGVTTLNGLILEHLGRIPSTGEILTIDGIRLEISQADQKKVIMARVFPGQI